MSVLDGAARHAAREAALQMLYQREMARLAAHEAIRTYWPGRDARRAETSTRVACRRVRRRPGPRHLRTSPSLRPTR